MDRTPVPKAPVDENSNSRRPENNVGPSPHVRQWRHVNAISKSGCVKKSSDREFRVGVTGTLALHTSPD
jgi:hypothetical protein